MHMQCSDVIFRNGLTKKVIIQNQFYLIEMKAGIWFKMRNSMWIKSSN